MTNREPLLLPWAGKRPVLAESSWLAPDVTLVGKVSIGNQASIWYGSVLRADGAHISIGDRSNIQDGSVVHTTEVLPVILGTGVSVGHRAVLHGCTVQEDVLVGMGAVLLNGCVIGTGSLIAAGTVVLEGTIIPPRSLVAGVPGKVRRQTTDTELDKIKSNAAVYLDLTERHREAVGR